MFLINELAERWRSQQGDPDGERGVALVLVLFVMLIGIIATATIAAAIFFVMNGNVSNRRSTQSFIAAESGRDSIVAALTTANATNSCTASTMIANTMAQASGPYFDTKAQSITVASGGAAPTAWNSAVAPACPTKDTSYVVIQSTGYGTSSSAGEKSKVLSVYQWQVTPHTSQSGTMAGTNGSFHGVGGGNSSNTLVGDLVVRTSDYQCSGSSIIDGDLWVLGGPDGTNGGNVTLTGGCHITGNVFANGTINTNGGNSNSPIVVGKSILASGTITMSSDGVSIGTGCSAADGATCGQVASGNAVNLTATGSAGVIGGAVTGKTMPNIASGAWKHPDGSAVTGAIGSAPAFTPPLNSSQNNGSTAGTVYAMTNWIEFGSGTNWVGTPAAATVYTCPPDPDSVLNNATGPVVLDYTGINCSASKKNSTTITLNGGQNVPYDAVFLTPPDNVMNVTINGTLSGPANPTSQIFFVHQSLATGDVTKDCGVKGNNGDSFKIGAAVTPRIMVYSPCGLGGTWTGTLTGQFYIGGAMTYNGNFTCKPMSWTPTPSPMPNMDCKILGSGGAAGQTTYTLALGNMTSQAEIP